MLFEGEDIALGRIVNAKTPEDRFAALADYERAQLKAHDSGNLVGRERYSIEAASELYDALSRLDDPKEYGSSAEMPALNYLSFVLARSSSLFWLVPAVISCFCVTSFVKKSKLMGMLPYSAAEKNLVGALEAFVLGVASVLLALMPALIVVLARSGLGDCNYPVVYIQNESVMQSTLIDTLLRQFLLLVLAIAFVVSVSFAVASVLRNPLLGVAASFALCLVPTISGYTGIAAEVEGAQSVLPYLPTTYLSFGEITGYPGAYLAVDILSIPGASFGLGVQVLLFSAVVVACAGCVAGRIGRAVRLARRGERHA